jgi:3-deoxy-D-manno-octulosonate 8-phosphate phosphatase (KDO 8-P phosphatase)
MEVLFLDVDGVLADGGIMLAEGIELKRFAARDGTAAGIAHRAGLKLVLVTFRDSEAVRRRAAELKIEAIQGVKDKAKAVREACKRLGVDPAAAAFMGDDLVDLGAMRAVGLAVAPSDATGPALGLAKIVTGAAGGQGAVREAVETILWLNRALIERSEPAQRTKPRRPAKAPRARSAKRGTQTGKGSRRGPS